MVQKDGPNKGKQFYTCSKPRENQCGFFQWAEDSDSNNITTNSYPHHTGDGLGYLPPIKKPRNTNSNTKSASNTGTTGKRKCSVCRQEGQSTTLMKIFIDIHFDQQVILKEIVHC